MKLSCYQYQLLEGCSYDRMTDWKFIRNVRSVFASVEVKIRSVSFMLSFIHLWKLVIPNDIEVLYK